MKPDLPPSPRLKRPQIKVCGLTRGDQAVACAAAGVDAIGLIFYPPSPRFVLPDQAKDIATAVGKRATVVGVFVDDPIETVASMAAHCGLDAVQLHGRETPEGVAALQQAGIRVTKAFFLTRPPGFDEARSYRADAFLLECGGGRLPGGNARRWDWSAARRTDFDRPVVLAGGLDPDNIVQAIRQACPDAVDVSSGVEETPGVKDPQRVRRFVAAVHEDDGAQSNDIRRIF